MKLLYHASLGPGTTSVQRLQAFQQLAGVEAMGHDTLERMGGAMSLYQRLRWRLGWPGDPHAENQRLLAHATHEKPDVVLVDNSKVLHRATLRQLRQIGRAHV